MVVLLAIGIAVGWKLRQWQGGKAAVRSSRHEVLQIAFPGATARRRPAKAVAAAAPRAPAAPSRGSPRDGPVRRNYEYTESS